MSLLQKQQDFTRCLVKLLLKADELGFAVTLGEAHRSDEQAQINALGGQGRAAVARILYAHGYKVLAECIENNGNAKGSALSVHQQRLAIDLMLFKGSTYLTRTEDYTPLGEYWESLHPDARWGGRFKDGNHFSFEHGGIK